jgi:hypothetical protein
MHTFSARGLPNAMEGGFVGLGMRDSRRVLLPSMMDLYYQCLRNSARVTGDQTC